MCSSRQDLPALTGLQQRQVPLPVPVSAQALVLSSQPWAVSPSPPERSCALSKGESRGTAGRTRGSPALCRAGSLTAQPGWLGTRSRSSCGSALLGPCGTNAMGEQGPAAVVRGQCCMRRELKTRQLPHPHLGRSRPKTQDMVLSFSPQVPSLLILN